MAFNPSFRPVTLIISGFRDLLVGKQVSFKIRLAAALTLLTVCSLISLQFNPQVGSAFVPGLVLEIDALEIEAPETDQLHCLVLVAVGDSSQTQILLPPPVPRPGHFIPLVAAHYRKGNIEYSLDLEKYLLEGPS